MCINYLHNSKITIWLPACKLWRRVLQSVWWVQLQQCWANIPAVWLLTACWQFYPDIGYWCLSCAYLLTTLHHPWAPQSGPGSLGSENTEWKNKHFLETNLGFNPTSVEWYYVTQNDCSRLTVFHTLLMWSTYVSPVDWDTQKTKNVTLLLIGFWQNSRFDDTMKELMSNLRSLLPPFSSFLP